MTKKKTNFKYIFQCLSDTLEGVQDGLSHFSGPSRACAIFIIDPNCPVYIFDPQNLLRGHEPILEDLYLEQNKWLYDFQFPNYKSPFGHLSSESNLKLAGLISMGGRSRPVFYQMWFTEHHPDMCSIGPTERWLEHAAWRFSHDVANESVLYTGISGSFLREYAAHAVRDHIVDYMNVALGWDTQLRIYPILDTILEISRTQEEGSWPRGKLIFVENRDLDVPSYVARFPEKETPLIQNAKHVCKLLTTVEKSHRALISDGKRVVGIADGNLPDFSIVADYRGQYGFLGMNTELVCSFADGNFRSTTHRAKLVQVEETLLESDIDPETCNLLFQTISSLVHYAEENKFGCTLVVDLNWTPVSISGQKLDKPLDLRQRRFFQLAYSLLKVDGAIHISRDLNIVGFACLLDGLAIEGEDMSRGARFNSALRFSASHKNVFIIVVSSDKPASIIQEGVEISSHCQYQPVAGFQSVPEKLTDWIENANSAHS